MNPPERSGPSTFDVRRSPSPALPNPKSTIENHQSSIDPLHTHAVSGNDDPRNGLALTPDAHWMFDAGLWTAIPKGKHFMIDVAIGRLSESSPHGRLLAYLVDELLHFHIHTRLHPHPAHLSWHRRKHSI